MAKHCWHKTGVTHHHYTAGHDAVICCTCGEPSVMRWVLANRQVPGHGRFYAEQFKLDQGTPKDDELCPNIPNTEVEDVRD